jgi:hypothetical protein
MGAFLVMLTKDKPCWLTRMLKNEYLSISYYMKFYENCDRNFTDDLSSFGAVGDFFVH